MQTVAVIAVICPTLGLSQGASLPPPPTWATGSMVSNLRHGVQLLSQGDFEFAIGHFRGALPPKPSRVYINESGAPPEFREQCRSAVLKAMVAWNTARPDTVEFVQEPDEAAAHVTVHFEHDVAARQEGEVKLVCGITRPKATHWGKMVRRSAAIRIAVFPHGVDKHPHKPESLVHVAGHELGHYLGLGESGDAADIMGPDSHGGDPAQRPSVADIGRFDELMGIAEQLSTLAGAGKRVPVPEEWVNAKPVAQHSSHDPHAQ